MKTTRIVLSLIVLTVLWCADVFAHDDGNPVAHFDPGEPGDPCHDTACAVGDEYDGGHGHINEYRDDNNNDPNSWGYWTCGGYAVAMGTSDAHCPDSNPNPPPPPLPEYSIHVISDPCVWRTQ